MNFASVWDSGRRMWAVYRVPTWVERPGAAALGIPAGDDRGGIVDVFAVLPELDAEAELTGYSATARGRICREASR